MCLSMRHEVAAGFVIYRVHPIYDLQFLLLRHSTNRHWSFPKGLIDDNESFIQTALRELEEETGIAFNRLNIHSDFKQEIRYSYYFNKEYIKKRVIYFLAQVISKIEEISLSSEHDKALWQDYDQTRETIVYQNTRRILAKAQKFITHYRMKNP